MKTGKRKEWNYTAWNFPPKNESKTDGMQFLGTTRPGALRRCCRPKATCLREIRCGWLTGITPLWSDAEAKYQNTFGPEISRTNGFVYQPENSGQQPVVVDSNSVNDIVFRPNDQRILGFGVVIVVHPVRRSVPWVWGKKDAHALASGPTISLRKM